MGWVESE
jgi:hypothetical protein